MSLDDELEALAVEIDGIAERLLDRSIDLLRAALDGTSKDAAERAERAVTRARRSLEKASSLLRAVDAD